MKRDLFIGGAGLVVGLLLALVVSSGGKTYDEGKVAGCQLLADAATGGLILCENVKGKLHVSTAFAPENKQNIEDIK